MVYSVRGKIGGFAMLSQADIKEIKKLYLDMFGIKLDKQTAQLKLSALVRQVELTYPGVKARGGDDEKVSSSNSKQKSAEI